MLTEETTYVSVIIIDWSRHFPRVGFQAASIGLHLAKAALKATKFATTVATMRPQSMYMCLRCTAMRIRVPQILDLIKIDPVT